MAKPFLGFSEADKQSTYGPFFKDQLSSLPESVRQMLAHLPLRWSDLPDPAELAGLEQPGYAPFETGYTLLADGSAKVAVKTAMPGVTPAMWDWWFGWHSSQDQRYKLWHPASHLTARWEDGRSDVCYVGRNSVIREYIGANPLDAVIQFQSPLAFGFSPDAISHPEKAVYICAKIGHPDLPVDYGYLAHQVRAVPGGSEMRSRFCLGGQFVASRIKGKIAAVATGILSKFKPMPPNFAHDLLQHCAEEMNHLAGILPDLYRQFYSNDALAISGDILQRDQAGFEQKLMSTLFNKIDPGQRPAMIAEPRNADDVIRIVRWAKSVGKRITISSGGHSFSANFVREDAVLMLMKHFDQYTVYKEAMRAEAGPGVGGSVLMKALYQQNLFFPAGHCKGVCIGGYLLQGGYGWNGRKMGIACQSVIGLDIVTADGELVHANAEQNADLFWAARGAGPGFFGVVLKFYLKVYPLPPFRAVIAHNFAMKHLEDVYRWAYEAGPSIPKAVEFQMLMNKNMTNLLGPGIEAIAPIFADTREEFEEAQAFMVNSPIKKKAMIATPAFNPGIDLLYKTTMAHYPSDHHWGVDNMWTHASIDELLPFITAISESLPSAPSHFLWLNWHPGHLQADMAYSKEDQIYLALYSCWKQSKDTALYGNWALDMMKKMEHLSTGIQLADEGLHRRTAAFMRDENLKKVQAIRAERDPAGVFFEWHSKPDI